MEEECKSVLLVDDVNVFLQLECMFLQRKGFKIFTARNGRDWISSCRTSPEWSAASRSRATLT
jgi:ActR/RegA family two-component response regulator